MATLINLADGGTLFKLDPVLDLHEQELRLIYTSERLMHWLQQTLPELGSTWNIESSPAEQLDTLFATYASGDTLTYGWDLKPIGPVGLGVWELKTADVRVFGWFARRDSFIGVVADATERVKTYNLYAGYRGEVVRFRDALDLDEPKFAPGDDPDDVVSNYS